MTLDDLLTLIDKAYPDHCIRAHWDAGHQRPRVNSPNGENDTLALFLVREMQDVHRGNSDDRKLLHDAIHAVKRAESELSAVRKALEEAHRKAKTKVIPFPKKK